MKYNILLILLFCFSSIGCDDYPPLNNHAEDVEYTSPNVSTGQRQDGPKFKVGQLIRNVNTDAHGVIEEIKKKNGAILYYVYYVKLFDVDKKEYIMERLSKLRAPYTYRSLNLAEMKDVWAEDAIERASNGASVSQTIE